MTPLTLERVKAHLRVSHSMEDEVIQDYMDFAKLDVIDAVYDSLDVRLNTIALESDKTFQRAVINLTSFYYEIRPTIQGEKFQESPFSVTHAIHNLRANRERYFA